MAHIVMLIEGDARVQALFGERRVQSAMYTLVAERALPVLIGLGIVALGLRQAWMGDAGMLHGYHRDLARPEDERKLARWSGCGLAVTGIGCTLMALGSGEGPSRISFSIGVVLFCAGIAVAIFSIKRYNIKIM